MECYFHLIILNNIANMFVTFLLLQSYYLSFLP